MFFQKDGTIRSRPEIEDIRDHLKKARRLFYISEVCLEKQFWCKGLAQLGMQAFLLAVARAPRPHSCTGYVFLSRAAFVSFYGEYLDQCEADGSTAKSRIEIEEQLIASYEKSRFKVLILGNREKNGRAITIMNMFFTGEGVVAKIEELMLTAAQHRHAQTVATGDLPVEREARDADPLTFSTCPQASGLRVADAAWHAMQTEAGNCAAGDPREVNEAITFANNFTYKKAARLGNRFRKGQKAKDPKAGQR